MINLKFGAVYFKVDGVLSMHLPNHMTQVIQLSITLLVVKDQVILAIVRIILDPNLCAISPHLHSGVVDRVRVVQFKSDFAIVHCKPAL